MIKKSFYASELGQLRKKYGQENIVTGKNDPSLIIKNFKPPAYYETDETRLFIDISDGFGFGLNVMNSCILLPDKFERFHLFKADDLIKNLSFADKFSEPVFSKGFFKKNYSWFFICFHFIIDSFEEAEQSPVGLTEYTSAVYGALLELASGNPETIRSFQNMMTNFETLQKERASRMEAIKLSADWKKIRWMR